MKCFSKEGNKKKKSSITKNIGKQKLPFVNKDESKNSDKIYVFFYTFVEQEKQQQPKLWLKISNKKRDTNNFLHKLFKRQSLL